MVLSKSFLFSEQNEMTGKSDFFSIIVLIDVTVSNIE
jgi:hypothetical protein